MPEITAELQTTLLSFLIISGVFALINYIITGYTLYTVSKIEKVNKPWLGWIPIGNFYQLIKLGKGNYLFIVALIAVMVLTGGPVNPITSILGIISSIIYTGYSMYMYYKICDRYDMNFIFIAIGNLSILCFIFKGLGTFLIPVFLVGLYGQWKLAKLANQSKNHEGRVIETKVIGVKKVKNK